MFAPGFLGTVLHAVHQYLTTNCRLGSLKPTRNPTTSLAITSVLVKAGEAAMHVKIAGAGTVASQATLEIWKEQMMSPRQRPLTYLLIVVCQS
jgi:hypothetical protein